MLPVFLMLLQTQRLKNMTLFSKKLLPILLLGFFLSGQLAAQQAAETEVQNEQLLWLRYQLEVPLGKNWDFEQEVEERAFVDPLRQGELRLRSSFIRVLGAGWSADAGFLVAWETESIEPYRDEVSLRMEVRPHQQISYEHSLGDKLSFEHSYKLEERFFEQQNAQGQYQGAGIAFERLRMKYSLEIGYQVNDWLGLEVFDELVFHTGPEIGPNPFDRNEAGGGLIFQLSDSFALQATYNYRYNPEGIRAILHQHIARFTVVHRWNP